MNPERFTLRELIHMQEGHEADAYWVNATLAGIFNRLGNGQNQMKCPPPRWLTLERVGNAKEEIALARDAFCSFVSQRQG